MVDKPVRIQIRIQRRGGPDVPIEAYVEPIHADWLWDLFDVPRPDASEEMVLSIPVSALSLIRNT